jgi:hypothetical protein
MAFIPQEMFGRGRETNNLYVKYTLDMINYFEAPRSDWRQFKKRNKSNHHINVIDSLHREIYHNIKHNIKQYDNLAEIHQQLIKIKHMGLNKPGLSMRLEQYILELQELLKPNTKLINEYDWVETPTEIQIEEQRRIETQFKCLKVESIPVAELVDDFVIGEVIETQPSVESDVHMQQRYIIDTHLTDSNRHSIEEEMNRQHSLYLVKKQMNRYRSILIDSRYKSIYIPSKKYETYLYTLSPSEFYEELKTFRFTYEPHSQNPVKIYYALILFEEETNICMKEIMLNNINGGSLHRAITDYEEFKFQTKKEYDYYENKKQRY